MSRASERSGIGTPRKQSFIRLTIDGQEVIADTDDLTIRERHAGRQELKRLGLVDDAGGYDWTVGAAMTAWSIARRSDPELTLEWVVDNVKVGDLVVVEDDGDQPVLSEGDPPEG